MDDRTGCDKKPLKDRRSGKSKVFQRILKLNKISEYRKPIAPPLPPRIFQKYPRGEGSFSEYINQSPLQGQIKMNNTREEIPIFIKICNPNSRLA